jgi:hypothetical protein
MDAEIKLTEVQDSVGTAASGVDGENIEWLDLTALKLLDRDAGHYCKATS